MECEGGSHSAGTHSSCAHDWLVQPSCMPSSVQLAESQLALTGCSTLVSDHNFSVGVFKFFCESSPV